MSFDLSGSLRRIRRTADLSQRQLAESLGVPRSTLGAAEAGTRDLAVGRLADAAARAGLRLALLDAEGNEMSPMSPDGARDAGYRHLPAHLDTLHTDEVADRWEDRPGRRQPWFTFEIDRSARDVRRARSGAPEDHDVPVPGDSPSDRATARRRAVRERRRAERERRRATGDMVSAPEWTCACPAACDELDDWSGGPVHADACPCCCDLG